MAATQAETQQNEVNSDKVVQQQQDQQQQQQQQQQQHMNLRNTLLQNGTEKSAVRGGSSSSSNGNGNNGGLGSIALTTTTITKTTKQQPPPTPAPPQQQPPSRNQITAAVTTAATDMSQYRQQESGPSGPNTTLTQDQQQTNVNSGGVGVGVGGSGNGGGSGGVGVGGDLDHPVGETVSSYPTSEPNALSEVHGYPNFPFGARAAYHSEQTQPSSDNTLVHGFGQFRHGFPSTKQPMIGPRPPAVSSAPGGFPSQRFMSGQSISQPTGPTPTLNQLLQSSNPIHRYQNSYGHGEQGPYGQTWPPQISQKPMGSYNPQSLGGPGPTPMPAYRNQTTLSSSYSSSGAASSNPSAWSGASQQNQHPPSSPGQQSSSAGNRQSPQPPSNSPGPGLPPSPHSNPGTQSQSFPSRPAQPTTPNAHGPDPGDLTGQNSNDSSSGPAPGTPNSQGMRPTPSPTGSTGSRSMSPAVGQQNIPMPPRPSSGQSDGSGPARMSHSPMATQSGYQQHLGPPPHMHGYKMGGHPGMIPSSGQQMPLYNAPNQYSQGNFPTRPQSTMQYGGPNQGYNTPVSNQQSGVTNSISAGQYTNRPVANHVSHSQFSGYQQNWAGPGVNQGPPPSNTSSIMNQGNHLAGSKSGPTTQAAVTPCTNTSSGPRPPHYLKQHLQHKMGFTSSSAAMPPSPGPPQGYSGTSGGMTGPPGMGPPSIIHQHGLQMGPPNSGHHHSGMGPPSSMGPPNMAPPSSGAPSTSVSSNSTLMSGSSALSNSHHDGPMPPPSSTPNSHNMHSLSHSDTGTEMLDNGITTTAAGGMVTHVTSATGGSVTSVVTTGPDGAALDEGSQQSTLSNASAASGEDPQCMTPKSRKNEAGAGHYSHPATPQSTVPSPGAASMNSTHEEYGDMSSPSWPRTPASPVFNSHVPPSDTYRSKKTDSLGKLYEMDDSPDRRAWLDKLLAFMEDRRTPITTCPTISKNPLDLFRLYVYVKERGGFMEVTKNKTWKDIAGMLGIGASSSAAYTLRKHYTKNLLAYECQFDRGGIDPQPIINQVEASSKKKGAKAASVPSPGSSNSQDSFPAPGSSNTSMDGYGGYGYPPGSTPEYNTPPLQRPSSQTNAPSPHAGAGVTNHHGGAAAGGPSPAAVTSDNVSVSNPFEDVSPSPPPRPPTGTQYTPGPHPSYGPSGPPRPQGMQQGYGGQSGYNQYPGPGPGSAPDQYQSYSGNTNYPPTTRPMYPPYGPEGDRSYGQPSSSSMQSNSTTASPAISQNNTVTSQDPYNRYNISTSQVSSYPPSRPTYGTPSVTPPAGPPTSQPPAGPYPPQQEYYRSDQGYPGQQTPPSTAPSNQMYPNGPPSKTMPPPAPQPRRHPDFVKDQQSYAPYNQQRPQMYGWPSNTPFRGQYQSPTPGTNPVAQQWNQTVSRSGGPTHNTQPVNSQWEHRYPSGSIYPNCNTQQSQQQWSGMPAPNIGQSSQLRPPAGARQPFRSDGKPFNMLPPQNMKGNQNSALTGSSYPQQPLPKREISFPPDSVEATLPVLYRRKRICRMDLGVVDAWRIMMCLRSGLLTESTYALDMLNILLYDDATVPYFGLSQWPGLLDLLLEHFRKSLTEMFDTPIQSEPSKDYYEPVTNEPSGVDLGNVDNENDFGENTVVLSNTPNYTHFTRKGNPIRIVDKKEEIFIRDDHKKWDVEGDATPASILAEGGSDFWQLTLADQDPSIKYILPCFQAEYGTIPFYRSLEERKGTVEESKVQRSKSLNSVNGEEGTKVCKNEDTKESSAGSGLTANCDKKKKMKTLSDVISRIKKESPEVNDVLAMEIKEKKTEIGKKNLEEKLNNNLNENVCENESAKELENSESLDDSVHVKCEVDTDPAEEESKGEEEPQLKVRDPAGTLKRRRISDYEDESYARDEASLHLVTDTQDSIAKRCICISNILRNLTFVPGNETEFTKNGTFLALLGKLLLLYHDHPARTHKTRNYDREEDADFADSCSSLQGECEWWWEFLIHIRENVLVSAANIAGHMDLSQYTEEISRPVLDGLLHWAICPSAHGQDPFSTVGSSSPLSPQRLALEALCKLCVTDSNVDLVIATPPFSRLERLCAVLTKLLCRSEDQVLREFAVNLLHYLAAADSAMARTVALQSPCVSLLVAFIEQAEQSALNVVNQHGINALRENPDSMGTSLDMLRRAAGTLLHLAKHPDNRPLFMQQEQRLLNLVMSQILDQQVAFVISRVLFQISRTGEPCANSVHS